MKKEAENKYCDDCGCEMRQKEEIGREFDVLEYGATRKNRKSFKHYLCIDCAEE